jgi:hypothetical protein
MQTNQAVHKLTALAQETRLAIFRLLVEAGPEGMNAGAIAAATLSFHDPHGEPLDSFVRVRDDIRTRLVPTVREALKL